MVRLQNVEIAKIHTLFTGPEELFEVTRISPTPANNVVSYLVVAGGGAGGIGGDSPAGGGAGGFREYKSPVTPATASPLQMVILAVQLFQ